MLKKISLVAAGIVFAAMMIINTNASPAQASEGSATLESVVQAAQAQGEMDNNRKKCLFNPHCKQKADRTCFGSNGC